MAREEIGARMSKRYEIHPSIGVARVGTSPNEFYLAPEAIGGLPIECDKDGTPKTSADGGPVYVQKYKDPTGAVRKQAALFKVFEHDDAKGTVRELTLDDAEFEWTVHLANKKSAWYQNQELDGDLMLSTPDEDNSYTGRDVPFRNAHVTGAERRRHVLIIDPGPRTVKTPGERLTFSRPEAGAPPPDYTFTSWPHVDPKNPRSPYEINMLGAVIMNAHGHLAVLGGFGNGGGLNLISTYTGSDSWYDDISDGPVTCTVRVKGAKHPVTLKAWVMVTPPKFAPELRNISTLDDVVFDVAVRYQNFRPELYDAKKKDSPWNPDFIANYDRDIRPIIERAGDYTWVANVPTMIAFSRPRFDAADPSEKNRPHRERYFQYYRNPGPNEIAASHQQLFPGNNAPTIPQMPLNSGSNSVTNDNIDKFMALTQTQFQLLKLWAAGKFTNAPAPPDPYVHALDQASIGNCVGHPMSPGVETSWNTRNPKMYDAPYRVAHRDVDYAKTGLDPSRDECAGGGCEPGDLTKRMSPPWQSDLYQCTVEWVNFTEPTANYVNSGGVPDPPSYYTYWWPPAAPMHVMSGDVTKAEQDASGVTAGQQVGFLRGLDNISRLVLAWQYLGFIVNQNTAPDRSDYPSFVERERAHDKFFVTSVAVGQSINQMAASGLFLPEDNYFVPMWTLKDDPVENPFNAAAHPGEKKASLARRTSIRRRHRGR